MDDATDLHRMASVLSDVLSANARDLEAELEWFAQVLDARLKAYFGTREPGEPRGPELPPPDHDGSPSPYAAFLREHRVTPPERLIILLALIPHVRPQLLDVLWTRNEATQRGFTEFGGVQGTSHGGFLPTGETAAFLLAGDDLAARFETVRLFESDQFLACQNVLHLSPVAAGESQLSGVLTLSRELLYRFTSGLERKPSFNSEFPARLIRTELEWSDLVLPASTLEQLEEIKNWVRPWSTQF